MYCAQCGKQIPDAAAICMNCGVPTRKGNYAVRGAEKSRATFILLGIFLGTLGIHNFYAEYTGRGVAQLLISLLLGWLIVPLVILYIWIIVELFVVTQDAKGVYLT